ncbi:GNAT family N-acetyltransferase [Amycolatopsis minnesotensis]|uniref:GNAT family N-acetyltransferase n=1 Tax=Amycolatopsis minnesotensis TaxID=337894 RepID=A0ABN2RV52_9PSEU
MEHVEINAGEFYLRQLRADDLMDDRPALVEAFTDPVFRRFEPKLAVTTLDEAGAYIVRRDAEWAGDQRYAWAIAEPTTGALLGETGIKNLDLAAGTGEAAIWLHPAARGRGAATVSLGAVLRFAFGAVGLTEIRYLHSEANSASRAVAERCGFSYDGLFGEDMPGLGRGVRWVLTA